MCLCDSYSHLHVSKGFLERSFHQYSMSSSDVLAPHVSLSAGSQESGHFLGARGRFLSEGLTQQFLSARGGRERCPGVGDQTREHHSFRPGTWTGHSAQARH